MIMTQMQSHYLVHSFDWVGVFKWISTVATQFDKCYLTIFLQNDESIIFGRCSSKNVCRIFHRKYDDILKS